VTTSEEILNKLKSVLDEALIKKNKYDKGEYPKDALPEGTLARSKRHDRLGVVLDAFYDELDIDNQKIITYTLLLMPDNNPTINKTSSLPDDQYYLSNEYEYDIIGYLMISPVNIDSFSHILGTEIA